MAYLATIAAFGFADFNPPTLLNVYKRLGCRTCQFYRNVDNPPDPHDARKLVHDLGMPFDSIHGVFGPEHDPSSPDQSMRRQAMETCRREGELALTLQGPMVVVHPGPPADDPATITPADRAARIDPMRRTIAELALIGEQMGVTYLIENIPNDYYFGSDPVLLAQMVRDLDHRSVRMCVDTGHAHMTSGAAAALDACADVTAYLHVTDNDGTVDDHRVPGDGTVQWSELTERITRLGPHMPAMLELFCSEQELEEQIAAGLGERLEQWLALDR